MENEKKKSPKSVVIPVVGTVTALALAGGAFAGGAAWSSWSNRSKESLFFDRKATEVSPLVSSASEPKAPNIVFILADDMGYGDISAFGSTMIDTPNLDALAEGGAVMTNYYAASSVCTPSRAATLTGRYAVRTVPDVLWPSGGEHANAVDGMPEEELTLAEMLKEGGYTTGMLGKWHLGDLPGLLPNDNGFDFFYGALYSNSQTPYEIYRNYDVEIPDPVDQNLLTKQFTEEAVNFITENKDEQFFLYYASPFPHEPMHASEDFQGTSGAGIYGDCIEELDWSVGQICNTIKELGLEDNTLIVFTSDNGPWYQGSTGANRGRKGQVFDGGQAVPFIAYWPGVIPEGVVIDEMAMGIDLYPTFLEAAKVALPTDRAIDGESILSLLLGLTDETPHDYLFYVDGSEVSAVRTAEWKYMRRGQTDNSNYPGYLYGPYLFDITNDVNESYNVIDDYPEIADELEQVIKDFEQELKSNRQGWIN